MKKYILKSLIPLIPLVFVIVLYNKQITAYINDKIFWSKIPKNVESTGAVIEPISPDISRSYDQLYALLDKDPITTDSFIITPIPKKRVIEVQLLTPKDKSLEKFIEWLKENGYESIPPEKIIYRE